MFHTTFQPNMNDCTRKPVPPLTYRTADGKLYTRFADVEDEIGEIWPQPPSDWVARKKKLKSETLVFLVKKGGSKDDYIRGLLQNEVNARAIRIAKGCIKGNDLVLKEEMALEVESQIFDLVWTDTNCPQAEYLEVAFASKVRKLTANVIERYQNSVMAQRDQLDVWTGAESEEEYDPVELRRDLADLRPDPEAILLLIEDESRRDELYQFIQDSVKDPRHFLALYLFEAEDKSLAEIAMGTGGTLIARAADVVLKERRRLVVLFRETPLHLGHCRNMLRLTEMGGIVMPPVPAFYPRPKSLDEMEERKKGAPSGAPGRR